MKLKRKFKTQNQIKMMKKLRLESWFGIYMVLREAK